LTGNILTIGGVKEKTIAARRSGVRYIVFPKDNKKDVDELEPYIKEGLHVSNKKDYRDLNKQTN